jgi:hypothetical protein
MASVAELACVNGPWQRPGPARGGGGGPVRGPTHGQRGRRRPALRRRPARAVRQGPHPAHHLPRQTTYCPSTPDSRSRRWLAACSTKCRAPTSSLTTRSSPRTRATRAAPQRSSPASRNQTWSPTTRSSHPSRRLAWPSMRSSCS